MIKRIAAVVLSLAMILAVGAPIGSATDVVSNAASVTLSYTQSESVTLTAVSSNPTLGWCPSAASLTTAATCSGGFGGGYTGGVPIVVTATNNVSAGHVQEFFYSWISAPSASITIANVQEMLTAGTNTNGGVFNSCTSTQAQQVGYAGTFSHAALDPGVGAASGNSANYCSTGLTENSGAPGSAAVSASYVYQVTGFATIPAPNSYSFTVNYLDVVY